MAVSIKFSTTVPLQTYTKLKKLAALFNGEAPADIGAVVTKLVTYWERGVAPVPEKSAATAQDDVQLWQSARGDVFPVGVQLRAKYQGVTYKAEVTPEGIKFGPKTYDSPSAAAIAVKQATGKLGPSANTNGWEFWEMLDAKSDEWVSIAVLKTEANH